MAMPLNVHYAVNTVKDCIYTYKLGVMEDPFLPRFQQLPREM